MQIVHTVMSWDEAVGAKKLAQDAALKFMREREKFAPILNSGGRVILTFVYTSDGSKHTFESFAWHPQPKSDPLAVKMVPPADLCKDLCAPMSGAYCVSGVRAEFGGLNVAYEILPFLCNLNPTIRTWAMDCQRHYEGKSLVAYAFTAV